MDAEMIVNPGSKYRSLSMEDVPQYRPGQQVKVGGHWRDVVSQQRGYVYVETSGGTVAYHVGAVQGVRS